MIDVKAEPPAHIAESMGALFGKITEQFAGEGNWDGLRQSHFRLLAAVPAGGVTITDLAGRLGMTKQGCGQFVSALADSGYLAVSTADRDARMRIVTRTAKGTRMSRRVDARMRRIEADWAADVGADRYAQFRRVLDELAFGEGD